MYADMAVAAIQGRDVGVLALDESVTCLEGPQAKAVVILQFSSAADAEAWYRSSEYQQAAEFRRKGANYRILMVQGV